MTKKLAPLLPLPALLLLTTPLHAETGPIPPSIAPPAPSPTGAPTPITPPPPVAPATAPQRSPWQWYGWQVALADVPAYALFAAALQVGASGTDTADAMAESSALLYLVGGPVVHGAHRRWGYSAASLGLRATVLFTGYVAGFGGGCHDENVETPAGRRERADCTGMFVTLFGAAGVGTLLDAIAFSWEPPPAAAKPAPAPYHAEIAPVVGPGFVGVGGRF